MFSVYCAFPAFPFPRALALFTLGLDTQLNVFFNSLIKDRGRTRASKHGAVASILPLIPSTMVTESHNNAFRSASSASENIFVAYLWNDTFGASQSYE